MLAESLADIRQKHPAVPVVEQAVEERPAVALVEAAHDAPLLVVGSRAAAGSPDCCSVRSATLCSTARTARSP